VQNFSNILANKKGALIVLLQSVNKSLLSTLHRHQEIQVKKEMRFAKFFLDMMDLKYIE